MEISITTMARWPVIGWCLSGVILNPIPSSRCFLEHGNLTSLLSTRWLQKQIIMWVIYACIIICTIVPLSATLTYEAMLWLFIVIWYIILLNLRVLKCSNVNNVNHVCVKICYCPMIFTKQSWNINKKANRSD